MRTATYSGPLLKFRVYYGLRCPHTDEITTWTFEGAGLADAIWTPVENVQVIVNEEPWRTDGKRGLQYGQDCYVWRNESGWHGVPFPGREHYLAELGIPKVCIYGKSVRNEDWQACMRRALKEGLG